MTKLLITGALKYLSEAAGCLITDRVISYGMSAFIINGENKSFNLRHYLPIVFVM